MKYVNFFLLCCMIITPNCLKGVNKNFLFFYKMKKFLIWCWMMMKKKKFIITCGYVRICHGKNLIFFCFCNQIQQRRIIHYWYHHHHHQRIWSFESQRKKKCHHIFYTVIQWRIWISVLNFCFLLISLSLFLILTIKHSKYLFILTLITSSSSSLYTIYCCCW
mgnify:CR=1 FL=1